MKIVAYILTLCFWLGGFAAISQTNLGNPSEVIASFYRALELPTLEERSQALNALFMEDGTIQSIVQRSSMVSSSRGGTVKDFLNGSNDFYLNNTMSYDEIERSIDYYVDVAMIHSLVFQSIVERKNPSVAFEQMLWFSFSMAYQDDRWYLTAVSWVNAFEDEDIDDAMRLDTLWHQIKD
ncbi:MAG: hypothetical protein RLP15_07920 [Cryomorphaceae bacterium]